MSQNNEVNGGLAPYAPPASDLTTSPESRLASARAHGFVDQGLLLLVLQGLLGLQALLLAVNGGCCLLLLSRVLLPENDPLLLSVSLPATQTHTVVYYVGIIPFAWFLVNANKNARAFLVAPERSDSADVSVEDRPRDVLAFTPASMVWSFFVPFLNLVRPYHAVNAVWASSAPERGGVESARGGFVGPWWAAWLASMVASRASSPKMIASLDYVAHDLIIAATSAISVVSCVMALRLVRALRTRQNQRAAELWLA